jgi:hypothetical protein
MSRSHAKEELEMRRNLFVVVGALALAVAAVMVFTGFAFAQADGSDDGGYSYGEPGDCIAPDEGYRHGPGTGSQEEAVGVAVDDGDCCGDGGPWGPVASGNDDVGWGPHGPGDLTGEGGDEHHHGPRVP